MPSPYDQQIEDLLAQYRDAREQAVDTRRRINEVEATVTAPRRAVKVTVGAQGQVTALEFPTNAYRTMAPKELSKLIVSTLQQARAQALEKVMETALGPLPGGLSPAALAQGDIDLRALLPEEVELPDAVRAYVEHGLGMAEGRGRE
ncbi:YbaB/EbfC family nucleoid-associated protein [Streptantibioticus ferralitis]|uniref:YbaB/EbfC family nucleoid-associated protein n=1 Tax=Streptantibioticus ferralitis TaxID=236510 RepID=A0ABT5Z4L7_9ACTN|nr:YbaB/EbfC family nucleoid-associated protein [Streptantibioticus ferralitis]MDF2258771.1 YbaB/EbfC family nucleoid-associated protein [Streptantibioticus ferralitis]